MFYFKRYVLESTSGEGDREEWVTLLFISLVSPLLTMVITFFSATTEVVTHFVVIVVVVVLVEDVDVNVDVNVDVVVDELATDLIYCVTFVGSVSIDTLLIDYFFPFLLARVVVWIVALGDFFRSSFPLLTGLSFFSLLFPGIRNSSTISL